MIGRPAVCQPFPATASPLAWRPRAGLRPTILQTLSSSVEGDKGRNSGLVGFALFGRLFSETMQSRTVTRVTARRSESWLRER